MDKGDIVLMIALALAVIIPIAGIIGPHLIGNKEMFDLSYNFDKAIVTCGEERIELEIESWNDYEGEQLQIKTKDGKVYLVSSMNTILIGD